MVDPYRFGFALFAALIVAWFGLLAGALVLVGRSLSPGRPTDPSRTSRR